MAYFDKIRVNGTDRDIRDANAVHTDAAETLTDAQKATARGNIGAASAADLAGKVDADQGAANAGKALVVGADGIVTTGEAGVPDAVKEALLTCFEHVAWADADGQTYYDALYTALYGEPPTPVETWDIDWNYEDGDPTTGGNGFYWGGTYSNVAEMVSNGFRVTGYSSLKAAAVSGTTNTVMEVDFIPDVLPDADQPYRFTVNTGSVAQACRISGTEILAGNSPRVKIANGVSAGTSYTLRMEVGTSKTKFTLNGTYLGEYDSYSLSSASDDSFVFTMPSYKSNYIILQAIRIRFEV